MKKGLSAEIINGNVGIHPDKEPFTFAGNGGKTLMQYVYEDFLQFSKTEDVDYIDVTNDIRAEANILPNPDPNADYSFEGLQRSVAKMIDGSPIKTFHDAVKACESLNHRIDPEPCIFKSFGDPAHVAFLGHELDSK